MLIHIKRCKEDDRHLVVVDSKNLFEDLLEHHVVSADANSHVKLHFDLLTHLRSGCR